MSRLLVVSLGLCVVSLGVSCKPPLTAGKAYPPPIDPEPAAEPVEAPADPVAELQARIDAYAPVELTADVSNLPDHERAALDAIIEAAAHLDPIYDRQVYAKNPALEAELAADTTALGRVKHRLFRMMRGPWDRQHHFAPFATEVPHPEGAGFYPTDMEKREFEAWIEAHPDDAEAFKDLYTILVRDGEGLRARPYHDVYREWLEPGAAALRKAAKATKNRSLAKFLRLRADAFMTDDYYASDKAWMDLDGRVEVTIGPYETYEDQLFNLKASYEAFVTITDPEASKRLAKFKGYLPAMEAHLPVPKEVKTKRGRQSPIRVVDLVFTSGEARSAVQTIAFNLPNDERVRAEKGAKKVLLRNLIHAKFDAIMRPIGERILEPSFHDRLSADAFFHEVLFHELSHSLGPAFVRKDGKKTEVRLALGPDYSPLEEAKADVMGAYNILFMIEKGEFPATFRDQVLVSYFVGLFRSVRFGVAESHGRGAAVQINRHLEAGAATFDEARGRFAVDTEALAKSVEAVVHDIVMIQHEGDRLAATKLLETSGVMSPAMQKALDGLHGVPVDLRPSYPLAGKWDRYR